MKAVRIIGQTFVSNQSANTRRERVNRRESFLRWRPFLKCSSGTSNQPSGNLIEASHWVFIFLFRFIWPDWLDFPGGIQEYEILPFSLCHSVRRVEASNSCIHKEAALFNWRRAKILRSTEIATLKKNKMKFSAGFRNFEKARNLVS